MIKRTLDVLLAAIALVVLSPLLLGVGALVAIRIGRPVLFVHRRPGRDGVPFSLVKFRTMTPVPAHDPEKVWDNAGRTTPFGAVLRDWSLDELPELLNVLKGDMSLVGPRPLLMDYLPLYSPFERRRHEVRPGLTGWAQVNGRNAVDWNAKFAMDVWYVDHRSLRLDLRILWKTIAAVFRREGVNRDAGTTMPRFRGSSRRAPDAGPPGA